MQEESAETEKTQNESKPKQRVPHWAAQGQFQNETIDIAEEVSCRFFDDQNAKPAGKVTPRSDIADIIEKHRMRHVPAEWRQGSFELLVRAERNKAVREHGKVASWHQAHSILAEECEEFWELVRQKKAARDNAAALRELVQVASVAQSIAYDMGLIHDTTIEPPAHKDRPTIVCLCGSSRFVDAFHDANERETMAGKIVLSIGVTNTSASFRGQTVGKETKRQLDELHKRKLDMADEVLVLNVGGYVGESTADEMLYAFRLGKPIKMLEHQMTADSKERVDIAVRRAIGEAA